jgi:uroporphyrinogen-III synthase
MTNPPPIDLPLAGRRIVLTRATGQSSQFAETLRGLGAEPIVCSAISIVPPADWGPLDALLDALAHAADRQRWLIFTSVNAVRAVFERLAALHLPAERVTQGQVAAIGKATARVLREAGIEPDFVPSSSVAETILAEIGDVAGRTIFLPQADIARPTLAEGLAAQGALVQAAVAYRTVPDPQAAELAALLRGKNIDAVTFTSSSTVRYTLEALQSTGLDLAAARDLLGQTAIASIGPITSQTAREHGLQVAIEAREHDMAGLTAGLIAYFRNT